MSTQSSFVTPATPLRAYASTADLAISPPSHRDDARAVASPKDLRTEPAPVRFIIIALAVTFLTVFVVLPLVVVFASAFSKGISAYFAALAEPEALSAIRLTSSWLIAATSPSCVPPSRLCSRSVSAAIRWQRSSRSVVASAARSLSCACIS